MKFEAVFLPEDRRFGDRISQTALRHYDGCPRSGYLYQAFKGEASTDAMVAGSAGHAVLERCTRACIETGEVTIPAELAKAIVDEVLAEYHVPVGRHDYLREAVYRWASETAIDPSQVIACETLIVLEVEGVQVRMRVDYADMIEGGAAVRVQRLQVRSRHAVAGRGGAPAHDPVGGRWCRERADGEVLPARALRVGVALRAPGAGRGRAMSCRLRHRGSATWAPGRARSAAGRGVVEIVEPFPLAQQAQRFELAYVFPGIEDREGKMGRREMSLSVAELDAYLQSLRSLVTRVRDSERTGDWPAQISDDACSQCPAPRLCPIPSELRDLAGRVDSDEDAAEAAERLDRQKALHAAEQRELKAYAKANGGQVRFGRDKLQEFVATYSETIRDKEGLRLAVERAVQFGEPFEWSDHVTVSQGTAFKVRTLTADELAAEAAERNGETG